MMRLLGKTLCRSGGGKRPLQSKIMLHRKSIDSRSCRSLHQTPSVTTFHNLQSSLTAQGEALPVASISSMSRQNSNNPWDSDTISALTAIAAAGTGALLMTGSIVTSLNSTVTQCEQEVDPKQQQQQQQEEAGDDDDPYESLPDEDPETTCYLCKTHRQGPCRSEWRKFEFCVKALDGDSSSTACDRYIKPFEECWMNHLNLYILIANTVNQELIAHVEQDFADPKTRKSMEMPKTDWTKWMQHLHSTAEKERNNNNNNNGNNANVTVLATMMAEEWNAKTNSNSKSGRPIWEYFDRLNLEPNLVMINSQIPIRNKDGLILRVAYAVDQDNNAVGYADYSPPPKEEEEEKDDGEDADDDKEKTATTSEPGKEEQHQHHTLAMCLLPGITEAVRISAVYAEEAVVEEKNASVSDDKPLDVFLYTAPLAFLPSENTRYKVHVVRS